MKTRSLLLIALLAATPLAAGQLAGVTLPDRVTAAGRELTLNGVGLREATVLMVDVYVAGLYIETKTSDPAEIVKPERVKLLELHFVRSVGKEKLAEAWTEGFDKNAGDKRTAVATGLTKLNAVMADVKKGDVLALLYVPGAGVAVSLNEREVAVIPGEDFQQVLYSIWVGPHPPNVSLREGLLGLARAK